MVFCGFNKEDHKYKLHDRDKLKDRVLPTYVTPLKQEHSEEDSLDFALEQVNHISKKHSIA